MLDFLFVMAPFFVAWWMAGWPGKDDPAAVKMAGLSFVFFGASMLLRLVVLGRQMPAGKYTERMMTTSGTVGFCVFVAAVGAIIMFAHHYFSNRD